MTIEDIDDSSHVARTRHYLSSMFGKDGGTCTGTELMHAKQIATEEMLDEIHFMLRELHGLNKK